MSLSGQGWERRLVLATFAALLLGGAAFADQCRTSRAVAPDGSAVAEIAPPGRSHDCRESIVEIRDRGGALLARLDLSSPDGAHGYHVEHSQWSKDSRRFVFSVFSSGGHGALSYPIYVYSAAGKSIRRLVPPDATVFPAEPSFRLQGSEVCYRGWDARTQAYEARCAQAR